ncbi:hypothetical protein AAFF_G00386870 [Aldrovandia affinis]|uniref:Uncharacterized protein n=1 Tax=Aldrovandia affinis TaxID=143900 RepID=A0AAD7R4M2_9TELE|nr:hypothetical protein AAFF_G00386870 [Aldrovandia affinis]
MGKGRQAPRSRRCCVMFEIKEATGCTLRVNEVQARGMGKAAFGQEIPSNAWKQPFVSGGSIQKLSSDNKQIK